MAIPKQGQFYKWLWKNRLTDRKVIKVKGWRTFLVDNKNGPRETITLCKWWMQ